MKDFEVPKIVVTPPGPNSKEVVKRDKNLTTSAEYCYTTIALSEAKGSAVKDVDGNVYIDFVAGIATMNVGHCNPKVVEAVRQQAAKLLHTSRHVAYYEPYVELGEKIREVAPGDLKKGKVLFVNSGTEAVEAALKLARYCSSKLMVIGFIPSFHGRAMGALAATASKATHRRRLTPLLVGTIHTPYAYCYRCAFEKEYPDCDLLCLRYLEKLLRVTAPAGDIAAVLVEPIAGEAGYIVPPDEFLPKLKKLCEENDILFIADEVQTGFGRTGKMFSVENWDVKPDMIVMAKAIASGLPLGALLAKKELMETWDPGAHGTTFGGNPLSCVAGLASLNVIIENKLAKNAEKIGKHVLNRLRDMAKEHRLIGDVRGKGLMIGAELVKDRKTKEPAIDAMKQLIIECVKRGLLVISCGESTIRLAPSLDIPEELVDKGLGILDEALKTVERSL